jgi:hypothetical protein
MGQQCLCTGGSFRRLSTEHYQEHLKIRCGSNRRMSGSPIACEVAGVQNTKEPNNSAVNTIPINSSSLNSLNENVRL